MRRKLLSIVLSLAMCITMLPMAGAEAFAEEQGSEPQSYVYYTLDGTTAVKHSDGVCAEYSEVSAETNCFEANSWNVVTGNVTVDSVDVKGNANLILCDGSNLTVNEGVRVSYGTSLNIYAQTADTGRLDANGGSGSRDHAGIGIWEYNSASGDISIHGGQIKATGSSFAAGIGGSRYDGCGHIVIYDGTVEANGGYESPGIGGGVSTETGKSILDIYGGNITASGGDYAAGIGGSDKGNGITVNVYGGTVTANGGHMSAGIGGGSRGNGGTVTINGGHVTAIGGDHGAGIGGGDEGQGGTLTLADGIAFGAGGDAESIDVVGDNNNASIAFGKKYFIAPYVHEHVYNKEIEEPEYLKSEGDGTCSNPSIYYKSCFCGEASKTETFASRQVEHKFPEEWEPEDGNYVFHKRVCTVCKTEADYDFHDYDEDTCTVCGYVLKCDVTLDKSKFTYSGKSNRPNVTVEFLGETVPAEEYDVIYPTSTVNVGTYEVKVVLKDSGEEIGGATYQVVKATPNLKVTTVTKKYKRSTIRKYSKTATQIYVSGAKGAVTYKKISGYKNLRVNSKTGKITCIKHRCGKATKSHSIKVKVTCAGSSNYNKASKTVTVTVKMVK